MKPGAASRRAAQPRGATSFTRSRSGGTGGARSAASRLLVAAREASVERAVLACLADGDERVASLDNVVRLGARDRVGLTQDGDDRDPVLCPELGFGEGHVDPGARVGHWDPLDLELAERHLEVFDDLRPLVGAAEDGAELTRLVVVEGDHGARLVVAGPPEPVELPLSVVVQDQRDPAAGIQPEAVLDADARQAGLTKIDRHRSLYLPSMSVGAGDRRRPRTLDSFIKTTPIVAVIRT